MAGPESARAGDVLDSGAARTCAHSARITPAPMPLFGQELRSAPSLLAPGRRSSVLFEKEPPMTIPSAGYAAHARRDFGAGRRDVGYPVAYGSNPERQPARDSSRTGRCGIPT